MKDYKTMTNSKLILTFLGQWPKPSYFLHVQRFSGRIELNWYARKC